jgi:hypothetical protein
VAVQFGSWVLDLVPERLTRSDRPYASLRVPLDTPCGSADASYASSWKPGRLGLTNEERIAARLLLVTYKN